MITLGFCLVVCWCKTVKHNIKCLWIKIHTSCVLLPASGRLPAGPAFPVHWLASVQRHAAVQALHPAAGQTIGQMAGAVWWRRWTHGGPLPVSISLENITTCIPEWAVMLNELKYQKPVVINYVRVHSRRATFISKYNVDSICLH